MNFKDLYVNKNERFSIGVEQETGKYFLSIPVGNAMVDYEEYYELQEKQFRLFQIDIISALEFVKKCRARELDDLLFFKPGTDRGVPL